VTRQFSKRVETGATDEHLQSTHTAGPTSPYADWTDTAAHQLATQVVGKAALRMTPWVNHAWHIALHMTSRGLTTPLISHPQAAGFATAAVYPEQAFFSVELGEFILP
jgi:hypothetical protein